MTEDFSFLIREVKSSPRRVQLIEFNTDYYKYPKNLGLGYYGKYPTERGLSSIHIEMHLKKWIELVNRREKWITIN